MTNLDVQKIPITFKTLGGGLNSTSGALGVADNESSELQNVDFDKFGSVLERNGYLILNTTPCSTSGTAQGLYWYSSLYDRKAVMVNNGKIYKMDDLDGVWDDITGAVSFSVGGVDDDTVLMLHCDGSNESSTLTDSSDTAKTVINTETYDSYTVLMLHCDGTNGSTVFTDSSLGVHSVTAYGIAQVDTGTKEFGTGSVNFGAGILASQTDLNGATIDFGLSGANTSRIAQSFQFSVNTSANGFSFYPGAGNNPPNIVVRVETDNADSPSGTLVHANATISIASFTASQWNTVYFNGVFGLSANTKYWLRFNCDAAGVGQAFGVPTGQIDSLYPNGSGKYTLNNGSSWLSVNRDFAFKILEVGHLLISDSDNFFFSNTNFTIDFWANLKNLTDSCRFLSQIEDSNNYWYLQKDTNVNGNKLSLKFVDGGVSKADYTMSSNWSLDTSTWYHLSFVRNSANALLFINGVSQTLSSNTAFSTNDVGNISAPLFIGNYSGTDYSVSGYMDEIRINKDISRWVSNFTPPLSPYGQVYINDTELKFGTGSADFKGYERLSVADSADWEFGSSPFTIDFWTRFNYLMGSHNNYQMFYQQEVDNNNRVNLWLDSGSHLKFQVVSASSTKADYSCSWSPLAGEWYHLALVRTGTSLTMYINGVSQSLTSQTAISTNSVPNLATSIHIGGDGVNNKYFVNGWIDELRISKGIARWLADFTPSTVAYGDGTGGFQKQDFETFLGYVIGTDITNTPWQWLVSNSTASNMTVVTGLTGAKFGKKFQNYFFLANVKISGVKYPSRFYYSGIKSITSWDDADFIDVSRDDGDEITGLKELGDRLVVYKNNSIYLVIFTGDADIPFIVQKSNSAVGCSSPQSIQANENGHIFCSYDGIYFFDGYNSYKISDRVTDTFNGMNLSELSNACSMYQRKKNRYWLSCASGTSLNNNFVFVWDSYLNSWSKYTGFSASAMSIFLIDGIEERPYFADYNGFAYRADYGMNDTPLGSTTAIDSKYYTNWKFYEDLCDKKGIPHIYITHRNESNTNLTLSYSYDFYNGDQYTQTFSLFTTQTVTALTTRRDLQGRGRFVRIGLSNNSTNTSFRIDGIGTFVTREGK